MKLIEEFFNLFLRPESKVFIYQNMLLIGKEKKIYNTAINKTIFFNAVNNRKTAYMCENYFKVTKLKSWKQNKTYCLIYKIINSQKFLIIIHTL